VSISSVAAASAGTVSYCLVKVVVPQAINIWVGLPMEGAWNGRWQSIGGGGDRRPRRQGHGGPGLAVAHLGRRYKRHEMKHEYREIADGDHGNVIGVGMPDISRSSTSARSRAAATESASRIDRRQSKELERRTRSVGRNRSYRR
jgi:hypothetical protein